MFTTIFLAGWVAYNAAGERPPRRKLLGGLFAAVVGLAVAALSACV